jgi:hypothetical protein
MVAKVEGYHPCGMTALPKRLDLLKNKDVDRGTSPCQLV